MQKKKKTRKEKIAEQQSIRGKKKTFNKIKSFVEALFFIGLLLTSFEMLIFRKTIIKWQYLFLVWLITGTMSAIMFSNFWKKNVKDEFENSSHLLTLFYNCVTFGGISIYLLMLINFNSPEINIETYKLKILKKYTIIGNSTRIPVADVEHKGILKRIIFTPKEKQELGRGKYIILRTKKGNLGYDVIVEKEITE